MRGKRKDQLPVYPSFTLVFYDSFRNGSGARARVAGTAPDGLVEMPRKGSVANPCTMDLRCAGFREKESDDKSSHSKMTTLV